MSTIDAIKRSDIRLFRNVEASASETAKRGKKQTNIVAYRNYYSVIHKSGSIPSSHQKVIPRGWTKWKFFIGRSDQQKQINDYFQNRTSSFGRKRTASVLSCTPLLPPLGPGDNLTEWCLTRKFQVGCLRLYSRERLKLQSNQVLNLLLVSWTFSKQCLLGAVVFSLRTCSIQTFIISADTALRKICQESVIRNGQKQTRN